MVMDMVMDYFVVVHILDYFIVVHLKFDDCSYKCFVEKSPPEVVAKHKTSSS